MGDAGGSRVSGGGNERRRGGGGNHGPLGINRGYGNWEARDDAVESVESEAHS